MTIKGSCACKRIQYETEAQPLAVNACHCRTCQQISGGPYLGFVDFMTKDLKWTQQPDIWQATDIAERGHCKNCGSSVSMRYYVDPDRIYVTLGTVETQSALPRMEFHIFLKDKAPYFVLAEDGARRYDGFPPRFSETLGQWMIDRRKAE